MYVSTKTSNKMTAILHCIITEIENNRIKDNIKYWRWMSNIYHNKKDTMNHLCEGIDNEDYMCLNYEGCGGCQYSYIYVPRSERLCQSCYEVMDMTGGLLGPADILEAWKILKREKNK
jgi:hypothetical protein